MDAVQEGPPAPEPMEEDGVLLEVSIVADGEPDDEVNNGWF